MVAVDVKTIVNFFCFVFFAYESPIKMAITSIFLNRLLG